MSYRARYRTDATGFVAKYAGQWASLIYPTRESLQKILDASPNGAQMETVKLGGRNPWEDA